MCPRLGGSGISSGGGHDNSKFSAFIPCNVDIGTIDNGLAVCMAHTEVREAVFMFILGGSPGGDLFTDHKSVYSRHGFWDCWL